MYLPSSFVVTVRSEFVSTWVTVTTAPATGAPLGSVTLPLNVTLSRSCAEIAKAIASTASKDTNSLLGVRFISFLRFVRYPRKLGAGISAYCATAYLIKQPAGSSDDRFAQDQ